MKRGEIRNEPVRLPDRKGTADLVRMVAMAAAVAAPVALYVHFSSRQIEAEYKLSGLVAERSTLSRERDRLLLVKASLLSPDRVKEVARRDLGMVEEGPAEMTVGVVPDAPPGGAPSRSAEKSPSAAPPGRPTAEKPRSGASVAGRRR
ncbi:MAG: cell division protein FtsL [Acidobacteriota bacterium]